MAVIARFLGMERRATPENPSFDLNSPEAWDAFGYSPTTSGVPLGHRTGLTYAPVWQAVNLISGDVAKLPLDVYRRLPEVGPNAREVYDSHPAWWLVRRKANRERSAFDFWQQVMTHLLLWNNAYVFIDGTSPGRPTELFPLLPDRTAPERLTRNDLIAQGVRPELATELDGQLVYVTETGGNLRTFMPSQILHFRGISIESSLGCDLVAAARDSWALGLVQEKFASKFFKRGGRIGGVLTLPPNMKKEARDNVEKGFRKTYEGDDAAFKTVILREGATFMAAQQSMEDSQMTESREAQVRDVARWFNLSPSKLGLSDSVSYNSKEEDNRAYLDSTLGRWLAVIVAECWLKLLSEAEQRAGMYFEHNTGALLRMDTQARFNVYQIGLSQRILTVNEVRAMENLNPVPWGDEPTGQSPPQQEGPPAENPPTEDDPDTEPEPDEDDERALKLRRLVFGLCARARHKSSNPNGFCEWVDGGLAWHVEQYRHEIGDGREAEWIAPYLESLRQAAEANSRDTLPAAIDTLTTQWEIESGNPQPAR